MLCPTGRWPTRLRPAIWHGRPKLARQRNTRDLADRRTGAQPDRQTDIGRLQQRRKAPRTLKGLHNLLRMATVFNSWWLITTLSATSGSWPLCPVDPPLAAIKTKLLAKLKPNDCIWVIVYQLVDIIIFLQGYGRSTRGSTERAVTRSDILLGRFLWSTCRNQHRLMLLTSIQFLNFKHTMPLLVAACFYVKWIIWIA